MRQESANEHQSASIGGLVRRRRPNEEVVLARKASEAVRSLKANIGPWQARIAFLRFIAEAESRSEASRTADLCELDKLLRDIERQADELRSITASLPSSVSHHSRFEDVVRATQNALISARVVRSKYDFICSD